MFFEAVGLTVDRFMFKCGELQRAILFFFPPPSVWLLCDYVTSYTQKRGSVGVDFSVT